MTSARRTTRRAAWTLAAPTLAVLISLVASGTALADPHHKSPHWALKKSMKAPKKGDAAHGQIAWACIGESWAALSCPHLADHVEVPVYDLTMPAHPIAALIDRIDETKAALAEIPERLVLVWFSAGALGPAIAGNPDPAIAEFGSGPIATGYAIRSYLRELRDVKPGLVVFIAEHHPPWDDRSLGLVKLPNSELLSFECLDDTVVYVDGLHLRPRDYRQRVRIALGLESCP